MFLQYILKSINGTGNPISFSTSLSPISRLNDAPVHPYISERKRGVAEEAEALSPPPLRYASDERTSREKAQVLHLIFLCLCLI